jgi:Ca2+-binding EF-hand superfamily protein
MKVYNSPFPSPQQQDAEVRTILKMLDPNGNGLMAESEIRQILATLGEPMSHSEVRILSNP